MDLKTKIWPLKLKFDKWFYLKTEHFDLNNQKNQNFDLQTQMLTHFRPYKTKLSTLKNQNVDKNRPNLYYLKTGNESEIKDLEIEYFTRTYCAIEYCN